MLRLLLPLVSRCGAGRPAGAAGSNPPCGRSSCRRSSFRITCARATLWERELVWLKNIGVDTVEFSIPWNWHQLAPGDYDFTGRTSPRRDLVAFIHTLRKLGLHAWVRPLPPVKGWLNNGYPHGYPQGMVQGRAAARAWLHELENLLAPQTEKHGGPIAFIDANASMLGLPAPPLPVTMVAAHDSNAMVRSRQALATATGTLLWEDVEDTLYPAGWERPGGPIYRAGAVSLNGDERPAIVALRRNAALMRHWEALMAGMKPERAHPVRVASGKFPARVTAAEVVSRAPGVASAVNVANESHLPFRNSLRAWDPFAKRFVEIENVHVAPHENLWLPLNVSLGSAGLCRECSAFSNAEHIVYATAELQTIEFENGTLAMEFAAPAPAEAVLQFARRPSGPYLAGGHPAEFDFDEKSMRVRLKIPQGKGPNHEVRVALAIEAPEHSAFFEDTKRLVIGRANTVSTSYSSEDLADRSRLRLPGRVYGDAYAEISARNRLRGGCAGRRSARRLGESGDRSRWCAAGAGASAIIPAGIGTPGGSHAAALRRRLQTWPWSRPLSLSMPPPAAPWT